MRQVIKFSASISASMGPVAAKIRSTLAEPAARKALANQEPMPETVPFALYFSDAPRGLYQLEQWLLPLKQLATSVGPVVIIAGNTLTALSLRELTDLPILLATSSATIENFVRSRSVDVIFYVNNNQANFTTLRINGPAHVHLSHGESEKSSMTSNQLKAYDFCFIAGTASRERILASVPRFDPAKLVHIGRPQLDRLEAPQSCEGLNPLSVLYAPTWEGDSPAMAYGSVAAPGAELAAQILDDSRFRLVYRPHPKLGSLSSTHRAADQKIRAGIRRQAAAGFTHRAALDENRNPLESINRAGLVITDISAMAMDTIGLNKKLLVLTPPTFTADTAREMPMLAAIKHWQSLPADPLEELLNIAHAPVPDAQVQYRDHVFGSEAIGTGTERFIAASANLLG